MENEQELRHEINNLKVDITLLSEKMIEISQRLDNVENQLILSNLKTMKNDLDCIKSIISELHNQSSSISKNVDKLTETNDIEIQRQLNRALRKSARDYGVIGLPFIKQKTPY
jgi:hypothetical protein